MGEAKMMAWQRDGIRIDVELAVALEVGMACVDRAENATEAAAAQMFNRDLWRLIGFLADSAPVPADRNELLAQSARVAAGEAVDFAQVNRRFAGILAGRAATQGSLRHMLEAWRCYTRGHGKADFGSWLVERLEGVVPGIRAA